jgi:hypothetical protein
MGIGPDRARCVVLVGKGIPRPERLLEGLQKRGAAVEVVHDAPSVMVGLAEGAQVVVVNEPRTVRRLPELLAAMRKYYPRAGCWRFEAIGPSGQSQLTAIDAAHALEQVATANEPPHPEPRANGKHAPHTPVKANGRGRRAKPAPSPDEPSLISDEELRMLLAPLPTDEASEGEGENKA